MSVKIAAAMPKADHNGLAGQEEVFERNEGSLVTLVIVCEVAELGRVISTDEPIVKLRIAEVEIVDREAGTELLRNARKNRTGVEELDFSGMETEDDHEN